MTAASPSAWPLRSFVPLTFLMVALVLLPPPEVSASPVMKAGQLESAWEVQTSWASGLVVPQGAPLEGGGSLSWGSVTNLTAELRLPNITRPTGITYALLSAMGSGRSIFQAGLGVWPGKECWTVYSWLVSGVGTPSASYIWTANSSSPSASPGDSVSVSITNSESGWAFEVTDDTTGSSSRSRFPVVPDTSFEAGDQEVLALESYARSAPTFEGMGNMTLLSLRVDGRRVAGGWYAYSGWDGIHSPLFVVGSINAPYFILLTTGSGQAVWSYDAQWSEGHLATAATLLIAVGGSCLAAVIAVAVHSRARKPAPLTRP